MLWPIYQHFIKNYYMYLEQNYTCPNNWVKREVMLRVWPAPIAPLPPAQSTPAQSSSVSLCVQAQSNPYPLHRPFCPFPSFFGCGGWKAPQEIGPWKAKSFKKYQEQMLQGKQGKKARVMLSRLGKKKIRISTKWICTLLQRAYCD